MPNPDVEKLVADWLAGEAPAQAPDRILSATSRAISQTRQHGGPRVAWRASQPWRAAGAGQAVAAVIAVLVIVSVAVYVGLPPPVSVAPSPTGPNATASTPPATPIATPSASPTASAPPLAFGEFSTVICGGVTVHDETGLISGCQAVSEPDPGSSEQLTGLTNPDGDLKRLRAIWYLPNNCAKRSELSFRPNGYELDTPPAGYDLAIYLPDYYPGQGCRQMVVWQGIEIQLRAPVAASTVRSSVGSAMDTDDRLTDVSVDSTAYDPDATYRLDGIYAIKSKVTETNQWGICAVNIAAIDETRPDDRGTALLAYSTGWMGPPLEPINDRTTVLPPGTYQFQRPALPPGVYGSSIAPCEGWTISLHALTQSGTDTTDIPDGPNFRLTLDAARTEFAADEPIDVAATLTAFGGTGDTLSLGGSGGGLIGFGFEQLDGGLHMEPSWTADCKSYTLTKWAPLVVPYAKSGGFSPSDPNADFYSEYFAGPGLRLPPGIWRLSASTLFSIGDCGVPTINIEASITIAVR